MTVCVARGAGPHAFLDANEIQSSTANEILADLQEKESILAFENQNFWEPLCGSEKPLELHPELVTNEKFRKYSISETHLKVVSQVLADSCGRAFEIRTNIENIKFPLMMVTFANFEIDQFTAAQVIEYCKREFDYDTSDEELFDGDTRIQDDTPMKDLLEKAKTSPLIFSCMVTDAVQKKIKHRVHLAAEVLSSEQSFVHDLNSL